jgi:hypothetical protein
MMLNLISIPRDIGFACINSNPESWLQTTDVMSGGRCLAGASGKAVDRQPADAIAENGELIATYLRRPAPGTAPGFADTIAQDGHKGG